MKEEHLKSLKQDVLNYIHPDDYDFICRAILKEIKSEINYFDDLENFMGFWRYMMYNIMHNVADLETKQELLKINEYVKLSFGKFEY